MQRLRSLTVASTCTFSYVALRASYVTIFQVNKSVFGSEPCTLSLFFSYSYWFHSRPYSGWWTSLRCFVCFFLDDEVHVWPFVSFEYDPIIATLSVLRTYFTSIAFLSIWDNVFVIMTTLLFAVIVSSSNWQSTHFCVIEPVFKTPV